MLVNDLRVYGANLHPGALGWTIPETTDGYSVVDVEFDTGQRLRVKRYAFERVTPETQDSVVSELFTRCKNTRFDADPIVAESRREEWIAEYYSEYLTLTETVRKGIGDQEVYAFTFPSLMELARLKGEDIYPVKIGFSIECGLGRIRFQILEKAGFPEKPIVLCLFKTWDGRHLEIQIHKRLRSLGRKIPHSLGEEWFLTTTEELLQTLDQCKLADLPVDRAVIGDSGMAIGGFAEAMAEHATIETKSGAIIETTGGQGGLGLRIRYQEKSAEEGDAPESRSQPYL